MRRLALALVVLAACKPRHEPQPRATTEAAKQPAPSGRFDELSRTDFNRFAVRLNLPIYWAEDKNHDKAVSADEVVSLLFYRIPRIELPDAYSQILAASKAPPASDPRIALVEKDLDQGRPTLVRSDFAGAPAADGKLVAHMKKVADLIDHLYLTQNGALAVESQVAPDPSSQSLFRRNRGPKCIAPLTENDPRCSAIPNGPARPIVDVYPADLQKADTFCKDLEARPDAHALLEPFTVVREQGGKLVAVPFSEAYKPDMTAIATELNATADDLKDAGEQPLIDYLRAAAKSFTTNDWLPADEAWAKMNADNSRWFVRVAPDEVYWDPCNHKAGFHLTFARIDQGSKQWQAKLVPIQQEMEAAIAAHAGPPYVARKVSFHLPDFIDIVFNAGDDRPGIGATIGQSLPNFGKVAQESRGRTVAMVNLLTDPDSLEARGMQAASVLDAASMKLYAGTPEPGLVSTILHEATHNLGPTTEFRYGGKRDDEVFGGPIASMLEELKAQSGALFLVELLRGKGLISDELARQTYTDCIVWALGHISQGMYTGTHVPKAYSNLAAIQVGFLLEHGALSWDDKAVAANGTDHGALSIHLDKFPGAVDELMKTVAGIKARGDRAAAEALIARYVDASTVVPHQAIEERFRRVPKGALVYSVSP
jgi:hypothetical protein